MGNLQGKRVLVTGAAGFIGSNLVRALVRHGASVHALVRPTSALWRIPDLVPQLILHRVDLSRREHLRRVINRIRPEVIFHLAKHGGYPSQEGRREILRTNILGTFHLLEATAPLDYRRFIHAGSSLEYGMRNDALTESHRLDPVTFFAATKAAASLLCHQFARANRRPIVILRPFSVYGYWEAPTRLVPTTIMAVLQNREMALTGPGIRRDWIFIEDVLEACLLAIEAEDACGEIINVGSGQQWSNEEVVEMIEHLSGQRIKVRHGEYPPRPSDTSHWVADIQKAKRLLGWSPQHTLRRGLEKTIAWFRLHHEAYADSSG